MKRLGALALLLYVLSANAQRMEFDFDCGWSYCFEGKEHHATLPRAFNEDYAFKVHIEKLPDDTVRYVKTFRLPKSARGKKVFVEFEGARQAATVFLNGHRIGMHGFRLRPYTLYSL